MTMISSAIRVFERAPLPDIATRHGIDFLVGRTRRRLAGRSARDEERFAGEMANHPIAEHADAANEQHYELPPEFFALTLGPCRKYSCCLYITGNETLAQAEIASAAPRTATIRAARRICLIWVIPVPPFTRCTDRS